MLSIDWNVKNKTISLLEKILQKISKLGIDKDFLERTKDTLLIKEK